MTTTDVKQTRPATTEIRFAGFGGQGVILSALVTGKAVSIFAGRQATLTRSFGPESRGGACSAGLVVADDRVDYPLLREQDILVAMSQAAYVKFIGDLRSGGTLIVEEDLVELEPKRDDVQTFAIPATRLAEQAGRKMVLNIVMLGFFTAITGLVEPQAMRDAIEDSVPAGTEELNLKAFQAGYEHGLAKAPRKG